MKLYTYWRSSAAYRVRIALNLKRVDYEQVSKDLVRDGGEHHQTAYLALNPQGLVPALEHDGEIFSQSLAIIEYLDERYADPPLLPAKPGPRAQVRSMALHIACEIHPLNNLRVLQYLRGELEQDDIAVTNWYHHWVAKGFTALEKQFDRYGHGQFCFGDSVSMADVCLVPQVYNAERFNCDLSDFPGLVQIAEHLRSMTAFAEAAPESQPGAT